MITFTFSWTPGLNMLLVWFLDVTFHRKCDMADEYITKESLLTSLASCI